MMECLLSYGVDTEIKNARGHLPIDLATNPEVKDLLLKAQNAKKCSYCQSRFSFKNIRYLCQATQKFYCSKCSTLTWEYETWESTEKEKPVCRSL